MRSVGKDAKPLWAILDSRRNEGYREEWLVSATIALVFAPLIILLKAQHPWVVSVPLALGTGILVLIEAKRCGVDHELRGVWAKMDAESQPMSDGIDPREYESELENRKAMYSEYQLAIYPDL